MNAQEQESHPASEVLAAFAHGRLEDDQAVVVAEHLGRCDTCQQAVQAVPDDSMLALLRPSGGTPLPQPPPQGATTWGAAAPPDHTVPPGGLVLVPGYEVKEELGRGGMGFVLKARDAELGRDLAVKVLLEEHHDDPRMVGRFREEAQVGGQLQHPGVVPIYAMGRLPDGRPYFTMKLVEGRTLADLLAERTHPGQDLPRFLKVFEQICQTLAYAHSKGVIHRDLKPANVMVGPFGEVQVMDWGLAKVVKAGSVQTVRTGRAGTESQAGSVIGTPAYMAPEQACGDVDGLDARCDVFGLGAVLCEMLTGAPPYRGRGMGKLLRQAARADQADAFGRLDGCGAHAELIALVKTCLAAEPADRPQDAAVVAGAMAAYQAGVQERLRQAELAKAAAQARAVEERKRRRLAMALAATVLLAVVGAGAGALWYQQDRAARAAEDARLATARAAEDARLATARAAEDARLAAENARKAATTERDVTAALEAAKTRGHDAAALRNDPAKWGASLAAALSAVEQAEGVLNAGVDDTGQLRSRVAAVREELEAADKDRRMIAGLEAARFQCAAAGHEGGFDHAGAVDVYRAAFRQDDKDWDVLAVDEAAGHINKRAIREALLAALEEWACMTPNKDEAKRLRGIVQAADPDPGSLPNRCQALLNRKDWDGLRRLAFGPESKDVPTARLVSVGRQLYCCGATSEAVKFFKEANERRPGDFWIAYELANASAEMKPPAMDEAIRYYTAALMLRPNSAVAHNNLGYAFHDKGQLDEAIAEVRKALQIQPDFADAHCNLGAGLAAKGQLDEAITECRKAIQVQPDYADAHNDLGVALYDKHQWDEAIAEYPKALQIQPDIALARNNLLAAWLRSAALQAWFSQDKELAATCLRALELAKDTTDPTTAERAAKICSLRPSDDRTHEAALVLARRAVELGKGHPYLAYFQMALGMAEYRSGHYEAANAALLAASQTEGNPYVSITSAFYRAMSLFRLGKVAEARRLATEAVAKMKPLPADEKDPLADGDYHDDLILWMACKEAKALLKLEAAPAPPREKTP